MAVGLQRRVGPAMGALAYSSIFAVVISYVIWSISVQVLGAAVMLFGVWLARADRADRSSRPPAEG